METMRQFVMVLDCDNAAFDNDAGAEIARVLRSVADTVSGMMLVEDIDHPRPIRDANGNHVGVWSYGEAGDDSED
jgi:hypothetical protein